MSSFRIMGVADLADLGLFCSNLHIRKTIEGINSSSLIEVRNKI